MLTSDLRGYLNIALVSIVVSSASICAAQSQQAASPAIVVNRKYTTGPVDRFFERSAGSDFPGTFIPDDSQAQLKLPVDELGYRKCLAGRENRL
jgi:hypothetical protein